MKFLKAKVWSPAFAQIDLKDCIIKLKDGSGNEIEVKIGEGNLTYTESRNIEYTLDRGTLDEVREGDEVPIDVSMDFLWDYLKGPSSSSTVTTGTSDTGTPTIEDVLKQEGAAAHWTSTDADACRPYAVDIEIVNTPSPTACGDKETILLSDFRYESLAHDLREGSVAVTGRCNVTKATITREANT